MNKEKLIQLSKRLVIIFMVLTFISILLPDEFVIGISKLPYRLDPFLMIIRWFNYVSFLALPVAVYFNKPTFNKIAVYFCLPIVIIHTCLFGKMLPGFISELGTGIADIRFLPSFIPDLLRNGVFRGIIFFATNLLEISVIALLFIKDKTSLKFNKKDILPFITILVLLIASIVPIYALEGIFDSDSNIKFKVFSLAHIVWMIGIVLEIFILYKIFIKKDKEDRFILLLILSLSLLMQYNQLFSSLGELTCKRMPLQLCNLASYIILYSLISKNRTAFLFNLLVNVAGAILAVIILDADNTNLISKGNIHYIVEHNNVVVIPLLCLMLGIFEPLKKGEFKVFVKSFTIYFVIIYILGTAFNSIYTATGNDYFKCNYLFMFDAVKAKKLIPFTSYLFDLDITIGSVSLYPLVQIPIYLVFTGLGYISYLILKKTIKYKA